MEGIVGSGTWCCQGTLFLCMMWDGAACSVIKYCISHNLRSYTK